MFKLISKMAMPVVASLIVTASAYAANKTPLIRVTAATFPGEQYYIGLNINDNQEIEGIYYQDDFQPIAADRMRDYPISKTASKDGIVLFQSQGYDLIFLRTTKITENEFFINLTYKRNVLLGTTNTVQFRVKRAVNSFTVLSNDVTPKPLKDAYVERGKFGIKRITLL